MDAAKESSKQHKKDHHSNIRVEKSMQSKDTSVRDKTIAVSQEEGTILITTPGPAAEHQGGKFGIYREAGIYSTEILLCDSSFCPFSM